MNTMDLCTKTKNCLTIFFNTTYIKDNGYDFSQAILQGNDLYFKDEEQTQFIIKIRDKTNNISLQNPANGQEYNLSLRDRSPSMAMNAIETVTNNPRTREVLREMFIVLFEYLETGSSTVLPDLSIVADDRPVSNNDDTPDYKNPYLYSQNAERYQRRTISSRANYADSRQAVLNPRRRAMDRQRRDRRTVLSNESPSKSNFTPYSILS